MFFSIAAFAHTSFPCILTFHPKNKEFYFIFMNIKTTQFVCVLLLSELRRSPRIQTFSRRHSSTFYSSSQSRSRNLDRALSSSQLCLSDAKACEVNVKTVKSPLRLLFGAAESPGRDQHVATRTTRSRLSTGSSVFEVNISCKH